MVLATFFMGATFPVAGQLFFSRIEILGRRIGSAYSINTVGAILGSLTAGFFLVPFLGTERTVLVGLFLNSALALFLLAEIKGAFAIARWAAIGLLLTATVSMRGELFWDPSSMDRGILIYARQFETRPELLIEEHYTDTDVVFFAEGKNASISVRRGNNYVGLRTNGKVDASNGEDMTTQLLLSYLPGFHHQSPEKILVIGYGSGVSAGAATVFPEVERVDCVEIEPAVVEAGPWFEEINRGSYDHPKVNIIYGDARNYLNISPETYDIIISEPSNPWIAGVGSLFTAEFYELAASALNPDGVFAQWIQLYELSPDDLRMVFAEFQRQFPEVSVWDMGVGDLVLLGSREKFYLDVERMDRIVGADSTVRRDFRDQMSLSDPIGMLAHYVMSTDQVREFSVGALRNTDDHPLLEFHAPRNLFAQTWDLNAGLLSEYKFELFPPGLPEEDHERAYVAIIEPLLSKRESGFAGQAVRELAVLERTAEESLYIAMARLNIDSRQFDDAEESLLRAEELTGDADPYMVEREALWGLLREEMGDRTQAMLHYIRVATRDPTRVDVIRRLAELNAQLQIWDEAVYWMQRYVQTEPDPIAFYWSLLGEYLMAGERTDEAQNAFRTALGFEPYSYLARFSLAEVLEEHGDLEGAIAHLEFLTVYALDRNAEIYTRLARIYIANQMWAEAERVLDKGARIFPTHTDIYKLRRSLGG
jgi:spermidine synthase/predicted negative regulator of RcsB-dependent stress response